jgi:pimeloyl-ACP methyl ester carboxylesterase
VRWKKVNLIAKVVLLTAVVSLQFNCKNHKTVNQPIPNSDYSKFRISQKRQNVQGHNLAYIDQGQGPVVLLLHGIPTSGWLYRNMIDSIADAGFRVIVPDMLGFGSSDNPSGYDIYSPSSHATRILSFMDSLKIDSWYHVCHDAGGLWTMEILSLQKERVNKMVLLNSILTEDGFDPPIRFRKGAFARFSMKTYCYGLTNKMMVKSLMNKAITKNNLSDDELLGYSLPLREGKINAMYHFFSKTCDKLPVFDSTMRGMTVPCKVIWGKNDPFLHWEPQSDTVKSMLGINDEDVTILEAKHFIQEEFPSEIAAEIVSFFKGN